MKQIIENLKSNREELISKYYAMKKESENLSKDIQQARENGEDFLSYKLSDNRSNLAIEMSSVQVAINTCLSLISEKDYAKNDYLKVISSPFQTMPVLFKEIKLEGRVDLFEKGNDVKIVVTLEYRYKTFENGSNGHSLGTFIFVTSKDFWENYDGNRPSSLRLEVDKVKGLTI